MAAIGRAHPPWQRRQAPQAGAAHQTCQTVTAHPAAQRSQDSVDARGAKCAMAFCAGTSDVVQQLAVPDAAPALGPRPLGTVAARQDAEHAA
jgi:hypothetical protein